ncbi:MAG: DUF1588 domain-containing protein [Halieaceae bacterium]|jgi:hypothetical protein|nr:DUF1588 domain-containing protein [Halieaceae bacterium]
MRQGLQQNPISTVRRSWRAVLLACATSLLLSGCFQTQLNGPVGGAQVTVAPLDNPEQIIATAESWDQEFMENYRGGAAWASADAFIRLFWIGNFQLQLAGLEDDRYYLVTAAGGEDVNADRNAAIDATYTPVQGEWHALMSGADLKQIGPKVTGLTEAVYQWIRPQLGSLSNAQIAYNLDRAARRVVVDISKDNQVTWLDALIWSRQLLGSPFIGDLSAINQVSDNVTANGSESERASLGSSLLGFEVSTQVEDTPYTYYADVVADAVVVCQACHVPGGIAVNGGARLSFGPPGSDDASNSAAFEAFLNTVEGAPELLLSKAQGVNHGGQTIYTSQTPQYQALAQYVFIVTGEAVNFGSPEGEFWDGLIMADARQTLRRAALIFAGRLPTDAEYAQAESGDAGLRAAILGLLEGEGFHLFLTRGANDRLHTDAFFNGLFPEVADINANIYYPVGANKYNADRPTTDEEWQAKWRWVGAWDYGTARAPVELIAHVVENDRPYTEILTADYTMVNFQTSEILRSGVNFGGRRDQTEFLPGRNRGQIPVDENLVAEFTFEYGTYVSAHSDYFDYPHAGVLNTRAFLNRYPTTETNRNRARARWTYLHFLDVDIEKSASRTTDPEALADTNNPTMNNPACTVCHETMDPVAGAFQNYSNEGWYRAAWGGRDSLPDTYKFPEWFDENAAPSPYREGDTWFRDMRTPGMPGQAAPNPRNSLQWLAQRIVADPRFARATVKFWWPAVMGADVLEAPGAVTDVGYQQLLRAFDQQNQDIQALADDFAGGGFNLKELLVDMAMSGWFRAAGVEAGAASGRELELEAVGAGRLLTPAELDAKTRALFGRAWFESLGFTDWTWDNKYSNLIHRYRIYYGGIDSVGVKERARQLTTLMSNVAQRQAVEHACWGVSWDFGRADNQRLLFGGVTETTTPGEEGRRQITVPAGYADRANRAISANLTPGSKRLRVTFNNSYYDEELELGSNLIIDRIRVLKGNQVIAEFEGEDFKSISGFEQQVGFWEGEYYDSGDVHWEEVSPGDWRQVGWVIWGWQGWISLPVEITSAGSYRVEVMTYGQQVPLDVPVSMTMSVTDTDPYGPNKGSTALREKIAELHELMLGEAPSQWDIDNAFTLLVDTWQAREERWPGGNSMWYWPEENCNMPGDYWQEDEARGYALSRDPTNMKGSWVSVLMYFMTHYSYLHE